MTGRTAIAVDAFKSLRRAERKVESRQGDLQNALARLTREELADYARATEEASQ